MAAGGVRIADLGGALAFHGGRWADRARRRLDRQSPPPLAWSRPDPKKLDRAIRAGAEFLSHRQRRDGSLSGFLLAPGASVEWITAHVAWAAEGVRELDEVSSRATRYLFSVGAVDGGWGYNRRVAPDFDSTAQALMALLRFGHEPPGFLVRWLVGGQLSDGSYPTYPSPRRGPHHGWQAAHPDTTQMAALCLRRLGREEAYGKALAYLLRVSEGGPLPSYWWPGYGYGIWLDRRLGRPAPAGSVLADALERSHASPWLGFGLYAAVGHVEETAVEVAVVRLLSQQLQDGSWPCAACLRVTSRSWLCTTPDAPGSLNADESRVFSTLHALVALAAVRSLGPTRTDTREGGR